MRNEKGQFVRKDDEDKEYHYPKFSLFYKIIMFIFLVLLALPWLPFVFKGIKNSLMAFEKISVCMENPQEIINQACLKTKSNKIMLSECGKLCEECDLNDCLIEKDCKCSDICVKCIAEKYSPQLVALKKRMGF